MAGKGGGPALIIGFGKGSGGKGKSESMDEDMAESPDEEGKESPDEAAGEGDELTMHGEEMFEAMKNDDKDAFVNALKKCLMAQGEGGYDDGGAADEPE